MPHLSRGSTISCDAVSGTWSMASGICLPVAKLSASVAWRWKR
jgi:hypothetical protein